MIARTPHAGPGWAAEAHILSPALQLAYDTTALASPVDL